MQSPKNEDSHFWPSLYGSGGSSLHGQGNPHAPSGRVPCGFPWAFGFARMGVYFFFFGFPCKFAAFCEGTTICFPSLIRHVYSFIILSEKGSSDSPCVLGESTSRWGIA